MTNNRHAIFFVILINSLRKYPMKLTKHTALFAFTSALIFSTAAQAQQQQVDYNTVEIKTTKLGENFYTLEGAGGTISALTGPDGIFLVDSQFAPLTDKLV